MQDRITQDSSLILVPGDIRSTCNNAADALACLACLDYERVGQRNGASFGLFALLETIGGALDAASGRYEPEEETEAEPEPLADIPEPTPEAIAAARARFDRVIDLLQAEQDAAEREAEREAELAAYAAVFGDQGAKPTERYEYTVAEMDADEWLVRVVDAEGKDVFSVLESSQAEAQAAGAAVAGFLFAQTRSAA